MTSKVALLIKWVEAGLVSQEEAADCCTMHEEFMEFVGWTEAPIGIRVEGVDYTFRPLHDTCLDAAIEMPF